jgi:hypothetical protein
MPRELFQSNKIYRECDAEDIFGFSNATRRLKIQSGEIPEPHLLSAPPSRARGWWGWQLNAWAERVEAQQAAWKAGNAAAPNSPKGGDLSKQLKKPAPPVAKVRLRKRKARDQINR